MTTETIVIARSHWHRGNGSSGCLFDDTSTADDRDSVVDDAISLFGSSLCETCHKALAEALEGGDNYFAFNRDCEGDDPTGFACSAGADEVEIWECDDDECELDAE